MSPSRIATGVFLLVVSGWFSVAAQAQSTKKPAASTIPARPEQLVFPPLQFEVPERARFRHELPGGVVAYVVEDRSLPLVKVQALFRTGAFRERPEEHGIARLLERMLRNGGAGDLDPRAFDEEVDFLAARIAVQASDTFVAASLDTLSTVLPRALDLFVAMLREPRFDRGRLAVEKQVLLEELRQRTDDAAEVGRREWRYLLFGEEHFSTRELTAEALERFDRDQLVAFHRRTLGRQGLILAISGDVETKSILAELSRRLEGFDAVDVAPWPPAGPQWQPVPGIYYAEKDIPQGKAFLGHLGTRWTDAADPELYALVVMNDILGGGGFTSRLTRRIRSDEGLAYRAGSVFGIGPFWSGEFQVGFDSKSETVMRATQIVLEEIDRLRREPPSREEVELVQRALVDAFPRRFDSAAVMARTFAEDERLGRPFDYWNRYRERLLAVTPEAVQQVATKYLHPERLILLFVGRWEEIARGDAAGRASLERIRGDRKVEALPSRDPLTLRPKP